VYATWVVAGAFEVGAANVASPAAVSAAEPISPATAAFRPAEAVGEAIGFGGCRCVPPRCEVRRADAIATPVLELICRSPFARRITNYDLKDAAPIGGKKVAGHSVIRWKRCYCGANEMPFEKPTAGQIRRPGPHQRIHLSVIGGKAARWG
jgi:hypothetical protein